MWAWTTRFHQGFCLNWAQTNYLSTQFTPTSHSWQQVECTISVLLFYRNRREMSARSTSSQKWHTDFTTESIDNSAANLVKSSWKCVHTTWILRRMELPSKIPRLAPNGSSVFTHTTQDLHRRSAGSFPVCSWLWSFAGGPAVNL